MPYSVKGGRAIDATERAELEAEFEVDRSIFADEDRGEIVRSTAKTPKYEDLVEEYYALWKELLIRKSKVAEVDKIIDTIEKNKSGYESLENATGVPWFVAAVIHSLEASLDFKCHLHNGDPLTDYTVHVPKGRPKKGKPPFTWEESAIDALEYDSFTSNKQWNLERICYKLEGFNGWGYRKYHPEVKSPYLWSYSNHYTKGKYVGDGVWSPDAVSKQAGAVVLLKRMVARKIIDDIHTETEDHFRQLRRSTANDAAKAVALALSRLDEDYDWGADVPLDNADWHGPWDCAEFVSWVVYQITGKVMGCVDNTEAISKLEPYSGAWHRDVKNSDKQITIEMAKSTVGAILVRKPKSGKRGHVAISTGDGRTIEAMGEAAGVARGKIAGRVWHGAVAIL